MNAINRNKRFSPRYTPLALAICSAISTVYMTPALAGGSVPVISPDVVGLEFQVNTETSNFQVIPSIAMDADGDFVVSWMSLGQDGDGDGFGVVAQRFSASGDKVGNEILVNTYTTGDQKAPSVAMDADGDFVVAWESYYGQDGNSYGVYAQRFNASGDKVGNQILVNTYTTEDQKAPSVAMDADGDFVVSWQSYGQNGSGNGVYAQRFSADGTPAGDEFQVNTVTSGSQNKPSVAMDADGDFVVSWESYDGDATGVYARRYSADGTPADIEEFLVNTVTSGNQIVPSVAMDADGDFVVSWQSYDGSGYGIYARRFSANGTPADVEFWVNTVTSGLQVSPRVAMDAAGDFVVSWMSNNQDGDSWGVYAQRYSADGTPAGVDEFQVNTYITSAQNQPSVAMDADGDFVVSWQSRGQDDSSDVNGFGVYAQRFAKGNSVAVGTVDLNLVVSDNTDPVTIGNNFIYSLITTNNGSGIALDVNLSEPLPTGITYVSDDAATAGWNCAPSGTTLECNLPFMNPGATNTIQVTVTASSAGTTSNVVTATAAQTDTNATDNTDTETTEIVAAAATSTDTSTGGGGGGSLGWLSALLLLPFALRRRGFKSGISKRL